MIVLNVAQEFSGKACGDKKSSRRCIMSTITTVASAAVPAPDPVAVSHKTSFLARFARNEGGDVAIIFALTTVIVVALVGGAVDYGRWLSARNQTQTAIDSALLAAGRTSQTTYGDATKSVTAANTYYANMKSKIVVDDTVAFASQNAATTFAATGSAYIQTPFLSIVGISRLPVLKLGDGVVQAKSTIAQGGNSGSSVEVAMMLDTTGSMGGQKLTDMKLAAKDLIDIVVWQDQSQYTSRIALAPFSEVVNVGDYFQAVTNQNPVPASHYVYPPSCFNANGTVKSTCLNKSQYLVVDNIAKAKCVTERLGDAEFTDEKPAPGTWVTTFNDARASAYSNRSTLLAAGAANGSDFDALSDTTTTTCPERTPLVPLTSNKDTLKAAIDGFVAENSTAGSVGTAWAWYLLSPEWSPIWPSGSKPETYSKLTEVGPSGQPRLQKIAVLMTDGVYNTFQGVQYGDNSTQATNVETRTKTICTNMKAKGIKVYSIGFQINDASALSMLQNCATDATYYYNATNGSALRAAFRDIALKISALRISQ
jgi:Flp pilus assembly protein TadG